MDALVHPNLSLQHMPSEVLALVLGKVSSAVPELWKAGDRLLCQKMVNGGVIDLGLTLRGQKTHLPRCISEFKGLTKLWLTNDKSTSHGLADDLKLLPRTLKYLTLSGHVIEFFSITQVDQLSSRDFLSSALGHAAPSTQQSTEAVDWNAFLPNLESLMVIASYPQKFGTFVLGDFVFRSLPRSLVSLDISTFPSRGTFEDFSALPPKLQILNLPLDAVLLKDLHRLPSTLTRMDWGLHFDCLLKLHAEPGILPHLTDFPRLTVKEAARLLKSGSPLPSCMNTLRIATDPMDIVQLLPKTLTRLQCKNAIRRGFMLQADSIKFLPPTLTELEAQSVNWNAVEANHWPSLLIRLELSCDDFFGPHAYYRLPRTLKKLLWRRSRDYPSIQGLTEQKVQEFDRAAALANGQAALLHASESELWTALQHRLRNYGLRQGRTYVIERYLENVNEGALYGLPLSLLTLNIDPNASIMTSSLLLPPQLTTLSLKSTSPASKEIFWSRLPPSLTSLTIEDASSTTAELIDWELCTAADPSSTEISKNTTLAFISLHFVGASLLSKYLPRNLRRLAINDLSPFQAEHVAQLPPKLESLALSIQHFESDSDAIAALPRGLILLQLLYQCIEGAALVHLPKTLQQFTSQLTRLKIEHVLSLPRGITSFSCTIKNLDWQPGHLRPHDVDVLQKFNPFILIKNCTVAEIEQLIVDDEQVHPRLRWETADTMWHKSSIRGGANPNDSILAASNAPLYSIN